MTIELTKKSRVFESDDVKNWYYATMPAEEGDAAMRRAAEGLRMTFEAVHLSMGEAGEMFYRAWGPPVPGAPDVIDWLKEQPWTNMKSGEEAEVHLAQSRPAGEA